MCPPFRVVKCELSNEELAKLKPGPIVAVAWLAPESPATGWDMQRYDKMGRRQW